MREHPSRVNRSPKLKACAECGKEFETSRPEQRFCSESCRSKNFRARNREKIRARQRAWDALNHPRKQPEVKACVHCGETFESSIAWQKFCSEKCRDADHYVRHRARYYAYTKQYRKDHPGKSAQACGRYYRKHRAALNAYTRGRYAEKKQKLAEAERIIAQQAQQQPRTASPGTRGPKTKPLESREYFRIGNLVQKKLARLKDVTAARRMVAKDAGIKYESVVRYHKEFRKKHLRAPVTIIQA